MIQQSLGSEWGVWCQWKGDSAANQEVNYDKNLEEVFRLETMEELAYVWKNSLLGNLENFLPNPKAGTFKKYADKKGENLRKIQSICFFRKGINPTWEDPANKAGGQFWWLVPRDQIQTVPVYQSFVFSLLGELLPASAHINGIRFVDKCLDKHNAVKVEIWVNFSDKHENMKPLGSAILSLAASINLAIPRMDFKNF